MAAGHFNMVWGAPSPIDENHHDDGDGDHWIHRSLDIEPAGDGINLEDRGSKWQRLCKTLPGGC